MEAWLAQDNWGGVFAYSKEPKLVHGLWWGESLLYVSKDEIPNKVKTLLKQQKAVKVDIHLTVTKIVQLPN